jgi:type II secretory pathway component PulC
MPRANVNKPLLALGAACAVLIAVCVQHARALLEAPRAETASPPHAEPAVTNVTTVAIDQLPRMPLFGVAPAAEPEAANTDLALTLKGTIARSADRRGYAIVSDATGAERAYAIGDRLPGDLELRAIETERIVLARSHELIALPLVKPELAPGTRRISATTGTASLSDAD